MRKTVSIFLILGYLGHTFTNRVEILRALIINYWTATTLEITLAIDKPMCHQEGHVKRQLTTLMHTTTWLDMPAIYKHMHHQGEQVKRCLVTLKQTVTWQ